MKVIFLGLAIVSAQLAENATGKGRPAVATESTKFSVWMDVKVDESQKVFASLARADFKGIVASTEKLKTVSKLEGLVRRNAPGYRTQLRAFEFAVGEIQRQAKRENIEGVTMGFNQLTLSCVNCHRQLRQATRLETPKSLE